jgi:pyruvate formate lyase activating enzyme
MSVEEVLNEVLADIDFYRNSGGGVTLSGGEPLLQLEFALALLEQSKEAGIHTCVETCGYLLSERFVRALPLTDLLLFDYKVTGRARHRLFTGAGNELILENLDLAYKAGVPTVLRCPVIPGLNDCLEHFQGIRDIAQRYPLLKGIEIMPYHKLGVGKRESIGAGSATPEWGAADGGMKDHWVKQLRELGCNNAS